jgi:hypothetical protein
VRVRELFRCSVEYAAAPPLSLSMRHSPPTMEPASNQSKQMPRRASACPAASPAAPAPITHAVASKVSPPAAGAGVTRAVACFRLVGTVAA